MLFTVYLESAGLTIIIYYSMSTKYKRRFDNFLQLLVLSIQSRDFCGRVVAMVRSKYGNTSVLGSQGKTTKPATLSTVNELFNLSFFLSEFNFIKLSRFFV